MFISLFCRHDDHLHPHSLMASSLTKSSASKRRDQVTVACDRCRSKKTKCDGTRPICSSCARRRTLCVWDSERDPDATPITAVKRKLEQIQPQLLQYQALFSLMRESSDAEALRVLSAVRSGSDIESALQAVRFQVSPERLEISAGRQTGHPPKKCHGSRSDSRHSERVAQMDGGDKQPYLRRVASQETAPESKCRRHLSAPWQDSTFSDYDPRVQAAHSNDWGLTYLDDETFRNIIRCFLTWDHPSFTFFDEDLFLDQLAKGQPSELCSSLLIHAMMALGSRNFYFLEPDKAAIAEHFGLAAATQQWDMCHDDASPAVIIAGMLLFLVYQFKGQDKFGWPYLAQAEQLARVLGLFRPAMAHKTFDQSAQHTVRTRGRQAVAWGIFDYRAYLSLINDLQPMTDCPSISIMAEPESEADDIWAAWPWPGTCRQFPGQLQYARSTLSLIVADIMPVHRRHETNNVTKAHYDAALAIYERLRKWYHELRQPLKSLRVSTPQVIGLHNYYQLALMQLFSPFVLEPDGPTSFLPSSKPLREAGLPDELMTATYFAALEQLKTNIFHFDRQWSPQCTPSQNLAPLVHVCLAALPVLHSDLDARYIFSLGLLLCLRAAQSFVICRAILRSIQATAVRKGVVLPALAHRVFARLDHAFPALPHLDKVRSTFIVDTRLRHTDVEASTLETLVKDMVGLHVS